MRVLLVGLLTLVVFAVLAPVLIWSVADQWFAPALWPQALGLRGFRALASSGVGPAAVASLAIAAAASALATALATALAYPAGRALGLSTFRGKSALRLFLFSPVLFPPMAAALGMHSSFIRLGLADTSFGVVLAHVVPQSSCGPSSQLPRFAGLQGCGGPTGFVVKGAVDVDPRRAGSPGGAQRQRAGRRM